MSFWGSATDRHTFYSQIHIKPFSKCRLTLKLDFSCYQLLRSNLEERAKPQGSLQQLVNNLFKTPEWNLPNHLLLTSLYNIGTLICHVREGRDGDAFVCTCHQLYILMPSNFSSFYCEMKISGRVWGAYERSHDLFRVRFHWNSNEKHHMG